jgi:gliding motility-associated-like protein
MILNKGKEIVIRICSISLVLLLSVFLSFASTFTVTSNADSGAGSLRDVVSNAQMGDIIQFSNALIGDSIVLTSGPIQVSGKSLHIHGLGADKLTISGGAQHTVFVISTGDSLYLQDLCIANAKSSGLNNGGAIRNFGVLSIKRCYFKYNKAIASGGAIYSYGNLSIEESTFAFNTADSAGGAILNSGGYLELINSTISNNRAGTLGGGINNLSISSIIPIADISHSTIVYNTAGFRGGGLANSFLDYKDTVITNFSSSLIALNKSLTTYGDDIYRGLSSRCYMRSNGYNLVGNSDSSGLQGSTGDIVGNSNSLVNPVINVLGMYGGLMPTHELLCGSPALDNGDPFTTLNNDQIGQTRSFNGNADIGAYEAQEDLYIPFFDLGNDVDTCMGVVILYIAGRPTDSVNWYKTDSTLLLANSKTYTHITGLRDSIVGEVISEAGCAGYDTVVVQFFDNEKPVISNCPSDIQSYANSASCSKIINWSPPSASDNCHVDTFYSNFHPGDTFSTGKHTVIYTAIDDANESTTCSFTITVKDSVKPVISCLSDISIQSRADVCGDTVDFIPPVGSDNCAGAHTALVTGLTPGSFFPVGKTTELYVVTDASNNKDSCSFDVIVTDTFKPKIFCPSDTLIACDSGICEATFNYDLPIVEENCSGYSLNLIAGFNSGEKFPLGKTEIVYEVIDPSSNKASCSFEVTVIDQEAPEITCPDSIESCNQLVNYDLPLYTDNCNLGNLIQLKGLPPGGSFEIGSTFNVFQIEDMAGNSAICSFEVKVNPKPIIRISEDTTIYYGDYAQLYVSTKDTVTIEWTPIDFMDDPYSFTPLVNPDSSLYYKVYARSQKGCVAADSVEVEVLQEILIPTAFTPGNRDGFMTNETWELKGIARFPDCRVVVFNVWGHKIFESVGYLEAWDGTWKGKDLPTATYYYVIDLQNGQKALTGNVTIIR